MTDPIPAIEADVAEGKAWYEKHPFLAGVIVGVIGGAITVGFLVHAFKL